MSAARRPSATTHDYTNYTYGCRCQVCRKAKADYMRARRAEGRAIADLNSTPTTRYVAATHSHGTRYAYEELGCRCRPCIDTRSASDRKYRAKDAA